MATGMKIVKLLDISMCFGCRFSHVAVIQTSENRTPHLIRHCTRLDCDNWQTMWADEPELISMEEERMEPRD